LKKEWWTGKGNIEEIEIIRNGPMNERVGDYNRKGHVEEIDGTTKGFMELRKSGDYSRKVHVEETDSTRKVFMEEREGTGRCYGEEIGGPV
jgi:hypothetical protein